MTTINKEDRLPIKIDSTSNGEYVPISLTKRNLVGNEEAHKVATENARKKGVDRRNFLVSSCGAAATLLAFNQVNASAGKKGGYFAVPKEASFDDAVASSVLEGKEFIFDVQGHFVNPTGHWLTLMPESAQPMRGMPAAQCERPASDNPRDYLNCIGSEQFIKDVFVDSDTDMMVLSFVPSSEEGMPLTTEEASETRDIVANMEGTQRMMIHGRVNPNQDGDIERMDELAETYDVSAFKTYTQWGPAGKGFFLSDEDTGIPFIEKALDLGVNNICVHKGIPFGPNSYEHSQCSDMGVVANRYPDMNFLVYHSGFVPGKQELPFEEGAGRDGIDTLIQSVIDNDIKPGSNLYAELGSTWRFLMRDPENAAHGIGKLLKYVGVDNVLWGTDSIWYGSPQDQIQAFRTFQISKEFQEKYGYPEITPEIRAKVFGLNATKPYKIDASEVQMRASKDFIGSEKREAMNNPDPHYRTYGPKNRREFLNLLSWNGGERL